jgi:hypothetical protein
MRIQGRNFRVIEYLRKTGTDMQRVCADLREIIDPLMFRHGYPSVKVRDVESELSDAT